MGINLANQTGREGKLSAAYAEAVSAYRADAPAPDNGAAAGGAFRLHPFDFHKLCGAANYSRLSLLWEVSFSSPAVRCD